ncbi:hypothetical protein ACTIVE_0352 [Actinomadura verrucosospora]|uniref:Uncharacterized protein n=1 Tax=Actinomadura verrucosospora TaxID=46165 RepID=A0A7D3VNN0_ACTVE|nr:hypothetical protein ACTIVE_0352 [Actinomadura verrucosospora]
MPCRQASSPVLVAKNQFSYSVGCLTGREVPDAREDDPPVTSGEKCAFVSGGLGQVVAVLGTVQDHRRNPDRGGLEQVLLDVVIGGVAVRFAPAVQIGVRGDVRPVVVVPGVGRLGELFLLKFPSWAPGAPQVAANERRYSCIARRPRSVATNHSYQ